MCFFHAALPQDVISSMVSLEVKQLADASKSSEERQLAKRRLLLRWHPDKNTGTGAGNDLAKRVMQGLQAHPEWNQGPVLPWFMFKNDSNDAVKNCSYWIDVLNNWSGKQNRWDWFRGPSLGCMDSCPGHDLLMHLIGCGNDPIAQVAPLDLTRLMKYALEYLEPKINEIMLSIKFLGIYVMY